MGMSKGGGVRGQGQGQGQGTKRYIGGGRRVLPRLDTERLG